MALSISFERTFIPGLNQERTGVRNRNSRHLSYGCRHAVIVHRYFVQHRGIGTPARIPAYSCNKASTVLVIFFCSTVKYFFHL